MRQGEVEAWGRRALLLARVIAATMAAWLAMAYASCDRHALSSLWLLAPTGALIVLAAVRGGVVARRRNGERAVRFYDEGLARIDERWTDGAEGGERFREEAHPYAEDLDLFGKGSLFGLLCTARTRIGQETLAGWLKAPAALPEVRARQQAIAELGPLVGLREAIASAGDAVVEVAVNEQSLVSWADAQRPPLPRGLRVAAFAVGAVTTAAVGALALGYVLPALVVFVAAWQFARRCARFTEGVDRGLFERTRELEVLSALIARIEEQSFTSPALVELRAAVTVDGVPAAREIMRLRRLLGWYDARRNAMQAMITAPLLLSTQLAMAIQDWRARRGAAVARWLRAAGQIEALASLAAYAYEHPDQPFPELIGDAAHPIVEGDEVGHPLIPRVRRVPNDVRLGRGLRLLLVSGSNMSGKSTYLRTVGVNVVLALAGAPVCARRMALTPLGIAATLRVNDSLQAGQSRFYAEITGLKVAVSMAQRSPFTLALLDEILHGTNSHDRVAGARAIVAALVETGALAIVTTHDLALAGLVDDLGQRARNVHFQDRIEDGKLVFDYRMLDGTITRTNALDLMRRVGLQV